MAAARSEPPADRRPVGRFEWERLLRRIVMPWRVKSFALLLSTYADPDGSRVRPGQRALAAIISTTDRTVRRLLDDLSAYGLIEQVSRGGGKGHSGRTAAYQLTIPTDLMERVELLSPAERPWVSPDIQASGQSTDSADTQASGQSGLSLVDNSHPPDTQVSAESPLDNPIERTSGDTQDPLTGHFEPIDRTPGCPTTNHNQPPKADQPTTPDPAQPETAHADGSQEDHGEGEKSAAAEPPPRCPHNLPRRQRPDGQPTCAFCRRDAARKPT